MSFALLTLVSMQRHKAVGGNVDSRRQVDRWLSVLVVFSFCAIGLVQYLRCKDDLLRRRTRNLFFSLCFVGLGVNYEMYLCNVRWVEVPGEESGSFARAGFFTEHAVLIYDGVIEVAAMYVPFFTIPQAFGIIKNRFKLVENSASEASRASLLEKV